MSLPIRVMPTRGFYLELKKRIKYIEEGYNLLKMKRDELIKSSQEYIGKLLLARKEFEDRYSKIMKEFMAAYFILGPETIQTYAKSVSPIETEVLPKSILGVEVPLVKTSKSNKKEPQPPVIREIASKYSELLIDIIRLAELETTVEIISRELERTNRLVNTLEKVIIPEMKKILKHIEELLEEDSLEEITRLKIVRSIIFTRRR